MSAPVDVTLFRRADDATPSPLDGALLGAYEDGQTAHAAMERNHGGGYEHPALVRAWTAGWEDAEIADE